MEKYAELTRRAAQEKPSMIIWPEAATPYSIVESPTLYSEVYEHARSSGAYLFLGSTSQIKFRSGGPKNKYQNSVFLIGPHMGLKHRYDKIILFPFGEYLPVEKVIPWQRLRVPNLGSYKPGEEYKVFECPGFRFSATICWENGFPPLVRHLVGRGAQFLVNVTNEAWFGQTASPYQFMTYNVVRAVENRRYIARCGNTGVTCIIDPWGRVTDRVRGPAGKDIFVSGYLTGRVVPISGTSFYTRFGDLPAYISAFAAFGFLGWAVLRPRRRTLPGSRG
jgi:apolipoprotein N-acyltransferase